MRQELVFVPDWEPSGGGLMRAKPVAVAERPSRVWTLFTHEDRDKPPDLPYLPAHNKNAFLEDVSHDWHWQNGRLRYFSRVADRPVWLLLEYEDAPARPQKRGKSAADHGR